MGFQARSKMKICYDKGKEETSVDVGNMILLKNQNRKSGLDQQYNCPSTGIKRKLPNIQIRQGNGVEKWVHLNRCKKFLPTPYYQQGNNLRQIMNEETAHDCPSTEPNSSQEDSAEDTFER